MRDTLMTVSRMRWTKTAKLHRPLNQLGSSWPLWFWTSSHTWLLTIIEQLVLVEHPPWLVEHHGWRFWYGPTQRKLPRNMESSAYWAAALYHRTVTAESLRSVKQNSTSIIVSRWHVTLEACSKRLWEKLRDTFKSEMTRERLGDYAPSARATHLIWTTHVAFHVILLKPEFGSEQ